ncbi:MAG: type II toxin-antitoxin system PemK/MazF family toxin [Spirochaetales bacterium]
MTSCKPGSVVEVPFPFMDVAKRKRRPALVLGSIPEAVVLAMITSAKRSAWPSDVPLVEWESAGLRAQSVVRLKLFSIEPELVITTRGELSPRDQAAVRESIRKHLTLLAG